MAQDDEIEGLFGIWPWPILNTILKLARMRHKEETDIQSLEPVFNDEGDIQEVRVKRDQDE